MDPIRWFADSADTDAVAPLLDAGLIHGVTTNPTILKRAGRTAADIPSLHRAWVQAGAREIFFQATGTEAASLRANAHRLAELERVVVKVPATSAGFAVGAELAARGAPVLITAVYTSAQALAAGSIGAAYIAPYLGRMQDSGLDGHTEVAAMARLLEGSRTQVLAASIRTPDALVRLAQVGVRTVTAAPTVLWEAMTDGRSDSSAADFEADARG